MTRKRTPLKSSTTTHFVPAGWTYLETLRATYRSLQEQLRSVELAIAVEEQAYKVKQLIKPRKGRANA